MEKLITVTRTAQGKKYVENISLQGAYLKKYGFELGEYLKVTITKGQIIIKTDVNTKILTQMGQKNPRILNIIENLSLTVE